MRINHSLRWQCNNKYQSLPAPGPTSKTLRVENLKVKKVKGVYRSSWETLLGATGRYLPYEITRCYLPPDTSERVPPYHQPAGGYSIYLPREGWKAELTHATRQCTDRKQNSRSLDRKSDAQATTPPSRLEPSSSALMG